MEIVGLNKDYYLAGNDIYIKVRNFGQPSVYLDLDISNATTGEVLGTLRPYPNLSDEYRFNICLPVRALFPQPNGQGNGNIQKMNISFKVTFSDGTTETILLTKFFIRGGVNRDGMADWALDNGTPLYSGRWVDWTKINPALTTPAYRIQGDSIVQFLPSDVYTPLSINNCNLTFVKYLNRLGGYEYWGFEQYINTTNAKAGKTKSNPTYNLYDTQNDQLAMYEERKLRLQSRMPIEFYNKAQDMINSVEMYIFDPNNIYSARQWEKITKEGTNKIERNSIQRVLDLELNIELPTYITREI